MPGPYELELPGAIIDHIVLANPGTRLMIANRHPYVDEIDVIVSTTIQFEIFDTVGTAIDAASLVVTVEGAVVYDGGVGYSGGYSGTITTPFPNVLRVELVPPSDFDSLQQVDVEVTVDVVGGGNQIVRPYSFIIQDLTSPVLLSAVAQDMKVVRITFDEPVVAVSSANANDALNPANYELEYQTVPAINTTVVRVEQISSTVFDLFTAVELTPRATYLLVALNLEDAKGNVVVAPTNQVTFTAFNPKMSGLRDIDLWNRLPDLNRREDATKDLRRFIDCLNEIHEVMLVELDRFFDIFDIDKAEEKWLDLLLADFGNPFILSEGLEVADKRRLLHVLFDIYKLKGTPRGVQDVVRFFCRLECLVVPYNGVSLGLGEMYLDEDFYLNPSGRYWLYAFDIVVTGPFTAKQEKQIREFGELMKPAHTHLIDIRN